MQNSTSSSSSTAPIPDFERITALFNTAVSEARNITYEHEVYGLLDAAGIETAPATVLLSRDTEPVDSDFESISGDKVVLKIVSATIIHKTDVGGVSIISNQADDIRSQWRKMLDEVPKNYLAWLADHPEATPAEYQGLAKNELVDAVNRDIPGIILVQYQPAASAAFGNELLIGIRNTREFGCIISAGIGGTDTELFAQSLRKGQAVVSASTALTDAEAFLELFKGTLSYQKLAGQSRGGDRLVSDSALLQCFATFIELGNYYSSSNPQAPYVIEELEVNPFSFINGQMVPLDGMCRFAGSGDIPAPRPIEKIDKLLHPSSIGIIGVSGGKMNFGRIILRNIFVSGYDKSKLTIIHPEETEIDDIKCVADLASLEKKLDLLVVAVSAKAVFTLIDEIIETDAAETVMLIPGGLGETEKSRDAAKVMMAKIDAAHRKSDGGPIFIGGNCLGVVSHIGGFDTWFIPAEKLPKPQKKKVRNTALVSQSGAFMITRLSKNPWLDPAYMIALGNQNDVTHSDMMSYFAESDAIDVIGLYIEGFKELDGLAFARAARQAIVNGKQVVVYKAGRSSAGQNATMGHTASIAGDYSICESVLTQAGVIITRDFGEFNDLFYMAGLLHNKTIKGNGLAGLSGAGFETVGMADSILNEHASLEIAALAPSTVKRIEEILVNKRLDALMEIRNPLDINPGADDEAHLQCVEAFAEDSNVDMIVVGLDPLSPVTKTLEKTARPGMDIYADDSCPRLFPKLAASIDKPVIGIVEGGALYDAMIGMMMDQEACIFRSTERAVHALVLYVSARLKSEHLKRQCA